MHSRWTGPVMLVVITLLAGFAVAGHSRLSGPIVLYLTKAHGVHRDDLIVVALWVVGVVACIRAWRG